MTAELLKEHLSKIGSKGGKSSWASLTKKKKLDRVKNAGIASGKARAAKARKRSKGGK